jgi:Domain of unknown function (DUF1996)
MGWTNRSNPANFYGYILMKFKYFLLFVLFVAACGGGGDSGAAQPPGLRVKTLMTPFAGYSTDKLRASGQTAAAGCGDLATSTFCAAFRISCTPSHMGFDDPIVNQTPGTQNLSHLHVFTGNSSVNYNTDITVDPQTTVVNASCDGGTLNRSMYWTPAMVDTTTGVAVPPYQWQVYYKNDGLPPNSLNTIPVNLRMIGGNSTQTTPGFNWFNCGSGPNLGSNSPSITGIVDTCGVGEYMNIGVIFGQCLSTTLGVPDVDSANHQSHTASPESGACPGTHTYGIPGISYQITYQLTTKSKFWRLSSDKYAGPAGYSNHGDFRFGWVLNIHKRWFFGCLKRGLDCHTSLINDRDENNNPTTKDEVFQ